MFKLAQSEHYKYPVTVEMVGESGAARKDTFSVVFRRLPTEQVTHWVTRLQEANRESADEAIQVSRELAQDTVIGWSDVRDAGNEDIAFSASALSQALDVHPVPLSIATAWLESVNGGTKRKNY